MTINFLTLPAQGRTKYEYKEESTMSRLKAENVKKCISLLRGYLDQAPPDGGKTGNGARSEREDR